MLPVNGLFYGVEEEPNLGERGIGVAEVRGAVQRREELGQAQEVEQRGELASRKDRTSLTFTLSAWLFYSTS